MDDKLAEEMQKALDEVKWVGPLTVSQDDLRALLTSRTADRERIAELEREKWPDATVAKLWDERDEWKARAEKAESRISELEAQLAERDEALANLADLFEHALKTPGYGKDENSREEAADHIDRARAKANPHG